MTTCTAFAEAMAEGLSAAAQELGATDPTAPATRGAAGKQAREIWFGIAPAAAGAIGGGGRRGAHRRGDCDRLGHRGAGAAEREVPAGGESSGPAGGSGRCRLRAPSVLQASRRAESKRIARGCRDGDQIWSIYQGSAVPHPTAAPAQTDEVYPAGIEEQVRVCVSQTGKTRLECREDIRNGNLQGPA